MEPRGCAPPAPPPAALRAERSPGAETGEEHAARAPTWWGRRGPQHTPTPSAISHDASICLGYAAETEPSDP